MQNAKYLFLPFLFFTIHNTAQIAINTDGSPPDSSAILDIQSNASGVLIPRMTAQQISQIPSPANGLMVFNLDDESIYVFLSEVGSWKQLAFGNGMINPVIAVIYNIGSGGVCSNTLISGVYDAGTPLGMDDTVNIDVVVTATGAWSITTDTINGISFHGNGWFQDTGIQTVTLYGAGWPVTPQTVHFTATANAAGDFTQCTFDVEVTGEPVALHDFFQGGVIVYMNGSSGLICSIDDLGYAKWGCQGTDIMSGNGAGGDNIGAGSANTLAILTDCPEMGIAADTCNNFSYGGYSDWYLPSRAEIQWLYGTWIDQINDTIVAHGGTPIIDEALWTSTEFNQDRAWRWNPFDSLFVAKLKNDSLAVRAFRSF